MRYFGNSNSIPLNLYGTMPKNIKIRVNGLGITIIQILVILRGHIGNYAANTIRFSKKI